MSNPFKSKIVTDPWHPGVIDVLEINREAFAVCLVALEKVRQERKSASVLLCGAPGTGKTHLLGRLRLFLNNTQKLHLFASVRLQTGPHRFWRNMRTYITESLVYSENNRMTQLEKVLLRNLGEIIHKFKKEGLDVDNRTITDYGKIFCNQNRIPNTFWKVLTAFLRGENRREAIAWFKGESLSAQERAAIGIFTDEDEFEDSEDRARETVKTLCRLAGSVPIVVCFDQIEALQRYPRDDAGLFSFGQAIRTLYDETDNVLLITCIQQFFLDTIKNIVMEPDFDALSEYFCSLQPLSEKQAENLIASRIEESNGFSNLHSTILSQFGQDTQELVRKGELTARKTLFHCELIFDSIIDPIHTQPIDVNEFLNREFQKRQPSEIYPMPLENVDALLRDMIPVMANIIDETMTESDHIRSEDPDILLQGKRREIRIALCNQKDMTSLAAKLKRLKENLNSKETDALVIIRHRDNPISAGAKKVSEYIKSFQKKKKVEFLRPSDEVLSNMAVLKGMMNDVKSGDLMFNSNLISIETLREWIHQNLDVSVRQFIEKMINIETAR